MLHTQSMYCNVCGIVDEHYDENSLVQHFQTSKHVCNKILEIFKNKRQNFSKNRDGIIIFGYAETEAIPGVDKCIVEKTDHQKIRIMAKPLQKVKFSFVISNDMRNEDMSMIGIQLAHPQPQFMMSEHPYLFNNTPYVLEKKTTIKDRVYVSFLSTEIGSYEMPIIFTFYRKSDEKNIIIVRDMVVSVYEEQDNHTYTKSPYTNVVWEAAGRIITSKNIQTYPYPVQYKIPKLLKILLPHGIEEKALENINGTKELKDKLRLLVVSIRVVFDEGPTTSNYMAFFHHLLWWEEIVARINLRKYNMTSVMLELKNNEYYLEVPGLAEKRPSLLRGDRIYIRPRCDPKVVFEGSIKDIEESHIQLSNLDESFDKYYNKDALFDVRFLMSRIPWECMHEAVNSIVSSKQQCRVFPEAPRRQIPVKPITRFYNNLVKTNEEQKSAVEHIVSGTSGRVPYIVFGPPGTGKTMTIVEAIIQLVACNAMNKIMVCTDSNMAADHIAVMLLKYSGSLNIQNCLLRANSQSREWSVMPPELASVSNGTSFDTFYPVSNVHVSKYRIFVTTLLHAAKYGLVKYQALFKLQMTHLFIDEAAQASEPATLVPITGLLSPTGSLVLAGDPKQLGPVCVSKEAKFRGLGTSLLERLKNTYNNLYNNNSNYITMLVKNFRSDPDILKLPNELFYDNCLQAMATLDPLSRTRILNTTGGERAIVFHAVNSKEQRMGNAPSFFNEKELDMLKKYVKALVNDHNVSPRDIGVIAPYIRQVYKMKSWLSASEYKDIEVGTVESFQGKEKRVILVSTVRANSQLLDYDAKYGLGFLVDDKRYNVTLTRAKAKLIIIGNPNCLTRDIKWRKYMGLCMDFSTYYGQDTQQLPRTAELLNDIARTRFDRCRLTEELSRKK